MAKRTFFTIDRTTGTVADKYTCEDIREALTVERVTARINNEEVSIKTLMDKFPEAITAASKYGFMKTASTENAAKIAGPYIVLSEKAPTEKWLQDWWTGFLEPDAVPSDTNAETKPGKVDPKIAGALAGQRERARAAEVKAGVNVTTDNAKEAA